MTWHSLTIRRAARYHGEHAQHQRRLPPMFRGSIVPIVTPFKNGELDLEGLASLIEWQIENGSHGISVTGTTGEPSSLTADERERVIRTAAEVVNKRVPF